MPPEPPTLAPESVPCPRVRPECQEMEEEEEVRAGVERAREDEEMVEEEEE